MNHKVVLAFSGGLDTSFCVKYLQHEKGLEVHSALVDTGGFSEADKAAIAQKAANLGVTTHTCLEMTEAFYEQCLKFLIFGNVLRNHTYPLSVSAERMFQAKAIIEYARQLGAAYVAHGSTGAGNDQVRFDLTFQVLAPEIQIITPIRDLKLSRDAEIAYLERHGIATDRNKAQYSINQGLWGTSVGGAETLTSHKSLPESAWPVQVTATQPQTVSLSFEKGELNGLNGKSLPAVATIQQLEKLAAPYGIGRDVHVGDTILGIKGRVGFAAAASLIILKAHQLLEKHTLTKWQQYWKDQLANWYGMMVHEGQLLDPTLRDIEQFMGSTQERVSGTVEVTLHPYRFELLGCKSEFDLMRSEFGQYGEMNKAWTGDDVKGFTKVLSNQLKIYHSLPKTEEAEVFRAL